jgi:cobyrinic acid a,c-diamide synthase
MIMIVTRNILADKLLQYINRQIDLAALVAWAEDMMQEADLEEKNLELLREILGRIGLADVREFGLTWDDCYDFLHRLGFDVKVELQEVK